MQMETRVSVADQSGQLLAPCTLERAHELLMNGHAVTVRDTPLLIRLTRTTGNGVPPSVPHGMTGNQKKKRKRKIARLRDRDGLACFYCGEPMADRDVTLEHLVAKAVGGADHPSNLVLAHKKCNEMAADMAMIDKVKLRERLHRNARQWSA